MKSKIIQARLGVNVIRRKGEKLDEQERVHEKERDQERLDEKEIDTEISLYFCNIGIIFVDGTKCL